MRPMRSPDPRPARRAVLRALAAAMLAGRAQPLVAQRGRSTWTGALLAQWFDAAVRHAPGSVDGAQLVAALWSSADLRQLWDDVQILDLALGDPRRNRFVVAPFPFDPPPRRSRDVPVYALRDDERRDLAAVVKQARLRPWPHVLRRALVLHTDLVTLSPEVVRASAGPGSLGAPIRLGVGDGGSLGGQSVSVHWELARLLATLLARAPSGVPFVRDWYRATVAHGQASEVFDALHLRRALEAVKDDPVLLMLSGCQHEAFSFPVFQVFAAQYRGGAMQTGIRDEDEELRDAERRFRQALALDPTLSEAWMRLGHVLGRLRRHRDSLEALTRALGASPEPLVEYYALLFLGRAHEAIGSRAEAIAVLERAGRMAPGATVPHLVLARLRRAEGDREGSLASLGEALRPRRDDEGGEPWWAYRGVRAHGSAAWLDRVRQAALGDDL